MRVSREHIDKAIRIVKHEKKMCEMVFKNDYVKKKQHLDDWDKVLRVLKAYIDNYPTLQRGLPIDYEGEADERF